MKFINKARKFIVILLVTIMVLATSQMIVLGVDDKVVPVVTPRQNGGEVLPGQEIKFKVTDNTKVSYIWYAWNRRTKGEEPKCYELPNEQKEYEYTTNAPKEPGLYEFSIAAQDHYGNVSYWLNIPYIVVNKLSGVVDTKKPTFTFDTPNNYPYHNSTIPQEMEITLQAQDDSGIYYIAYKWTREIVKNDTGATLVFNETNSKSFTAKITAPEEPGYWYLLVYARDGANNLSSTYATGVTIKDTDYTALQGKVDSNEEKFVESDYTPESWQDFKNAITDANNMLKENKSSQKKVDEQTNKIDESITSLQPKEVNKEELDNYINSLVSTDYDNWDDFDHLVTEAKDEGIKLQSEFDKKLQKVKEFTLKAKEIDTSKLDKIEEELAKLDSNDYTEKSWNDIKDKITEAKEQTLQSKFDEKVEEINLDKLVIIPKITNVSTEPQYVPEGHDVTITFETNIELSLSEDHTTATISGEKGTITNDGENKYKITYKVKTEDASKGSISYAIKPVTDNNGEKVEGKEVTGEISIADYMTGIKITKEPDNKQYTIGDKEINLDGGRIRILWASNKKGSLVDMTNEAISVSGFDTTSAGTKTITITYEGLTDTFDIEVMKKDPSKNDLVVTPVTAIYDGTPKAVNVNPKDGIEGLGEVVSIKYCQLVEGAEQSALEGTPTNAGEYKIRVSLAEGEKYKSRNGFEVGTLTIEKADYDMSNVKFEDKTLVYNGEYQEITISGDLPDGVNVTYEHNKRKEVGTRTATAKFTGDSNNYNAIDDMSATITITKATYDMSNVKFLDKTETYNEGTHEIKITGDLPAGVTVEYEGNDKTDVGEYTVTAKFTGGEDKDNYNDIPNMTAKLTIEKATYNMEGIGFADKTETYNGSEHNITLTGNLPKDVLVRYEGNGQIRAGEYTITAIFTGDEKNYNAIPNMTATLKIEKATYDMNSVTFTGKTVTYNGEVQELQIGGGLPEGVEVSYQNNENIEVGEYTVTAKFAGDAENYNLISDMQATLKIEQATPEHIEPGILTAIYGQTLADVKSQLPERFTFQSDLETSVGEVGTRYFSATYTPEDTKNYKIVTDIRVAIRVGKATYAMSGVKFEDKTFTYDGELHSIVVEGQLPDGVEVSYESNERRKSGTSIAKAKFTGDEKNYNAIDDMTATLKVEQATPEYTVPTGLTATYGQKLKDIESQLTEGFEFQDNEEETEVGTVGTNTFKVKYVPTDTTNYKTIENIEVQIEVSKAKPYYKTPEDLKATYGQKLSDVKLPDSKFTFQDELTTPAGNVGENTFLVTYTPDDTNNYEIVKDIEVKITVSKASAPEIIYPTATPIVYGQSLKESTLVGGSIEYGTFAWKASDHIPTAGTGAYIVVFTANDNTTQNYEEITTTQRKVTLEVEKATYDMENITFDGKTVEYTGEVQELAITGDLPAGVKVEYEGNDKKDVGVYTVIAKFTGGDDKENYNEIPNKEATLTITPKTPTIDDLQHGLPASKEYTGKARPITVKAKEGIDGLGEITVKYNDSTEEPVNVGKYKVTVDITEGKNYSSATGIELGEYEITKKAPSKEDLKYHIENKEYTGLAQGLEVTANDGVQGLGKITVKYNDSTEKPVNVGTYTISVDIAEGTNYSAAQIELEGTYEITTKTPTIEDLVYNLTSKEYTGERQPVTVSAKEGIDGLGEITVKYNGDKTEPLDAKKYTVTVDIAKGTNYSSTSNIELGEYEITKKTPTKDDLTYDLSNKSYTGSEQPVTVNAKAGIRGLGNSITVKYNGSLEQPVNAGTYTITADVEGGVNYLSATNIELGTYTITSSETALEKGNFQINSKTSFEYNGQPHTVEVSAKDVTLLGEIIVKYYQTVDGKEVEVKSPTNVGTYTIKVTTVGATNYEDVTDLEFTTKLEITPVNITVKADNITAIYGDEAKELTLSTDVVSGSLVGEDKITDLGIKLKTYLSERDEEIEINTTTAVGEYKIKDENKVYGNYNVTVQEGTYTIETKGITVKADNKTATYGDTAQKLTFSEVIEPEGTTALVNGEELSVLAIELKTYKNDSPDEEQTISETTSIGTYRIKAESKVYGNYNVTVQEGTYTIEAKAITVKADDKESSYGEECQELTYSEVKVEESALVNGEDLKTALGITLKTYKDGDEVSLLNTTNAGTYTIKGESKVYGNYNVTVQDGTYTITPSKTKLQTNNFIIKGSTTVEYDGQPHTIEVKAKNVVLLGTITVKYYDFEGEEVEAPTNAGEYIIKITTNGATNYEDVTDLAFTTKLKITPVSITVKANDITAVYGDEGQELTYKETTEPSALVNDEKLSILGIKLKTYKIADEVEITPETPAGTYTIKADSGVYGNYNVTITEGTYTINKKAQEKPDVSIDKTNVLMTENAPVITVKNVPAENGAITYESSNTSAIDIDTSTGAMTLKGEGQTQITVSFGGSLNYDRTKGDPITVTVSKDTLTIGVDGDFVYDLSSKEYTGEGQGIDVTAKEELSELIGEISVSYNKIEENEVTKTPIQGTEYASEDGKPKNAGKYEVILNVTAGTHYEELKNQVLGTYEITKKPQEKPNVSIDNQNILITAKEAPKITLYNSPTEEGITTYTSSNESVLTVDSTPTITLKGAGETQITVTFGETENYSATQSDPITVTVSKDTLNTEKDSGNFIYELETSKEYTGKEQGIEVKVKEGITGYGDISVSYNKVETLERDAQTITPVEGIPIDAGTYQVILNVTEGEKYSAIENKLLGTYTINPKAISDATVAIELLSTDELIYDGNPKAVKNVKVTLDENTLVKNKDYTLQIEYSKPEGGYTADAPIQPGKYRARVSVEGIGNYTGNKGNAIYYTITPIQAISVDITPPGPKEELKNIYKFGEELDLKDWTIDVTYNNGNEETMSVNKAKEDGIITVEYDFSQPGDEKNVEIKFNGEAVFSYTVAVKDYIKEIQLDEESTTVVYKESELSEISDIKMKVVAVKASGKTPDITKKVDVKVDCDLSDLNKVGQKTVTVSYEDTYEKNYSFGDTFTITFKIAVVPDATQDIDYIIMLNGPAEDYVDVYSEYEDKGTTVYNLKEGLMDEIKVETTGIVNTEEVGEYEITYSTEGAKESAKRTVHVVDRVAPEIKLNKDMQSKEDIEVEANGDESIIRFTKGTKISFTLETFVSATDNYDTNKGKAIKIDYTVNYNSEPSEIHEIDEESEAGIYEVTYTATDSSENSSKKTVKVVILDYPPIIYYLGENDVKIEIENGKLYNDYLKIGCDKENVKIYIKKDEEEEKLYNGEEILKDGTYTIRTVENDYISSVGLVFTIDTIPPEVSLDVDNNKITFTNPSDVYKAKMTSGSGKWIYTIKDDETDENNIGEDGVYTIPDEASTHAIVYTLTVEDASGNKITPITFKLSK